MFFLLHIFFGVLPFLRLGAELQFFSRHFNVDARLLEGTPGGAQKSKKDDRVLLCADLEITMKCESARD